MIGTYLKDYMEKNDINQIFVSEQTGICPQLLSAMLNGQKKMEIAEYFDICAALGTTPTDIAIASGYYAVAEQK